MEPRHYSEFHPAYARELDRMLHGHLLTVGPEDREQVVCVDRVKQVTVGIDDRGIYCGIEVYDTTDRVWVLYSDGTIEDVATDYDVVGRHDITFSTLRTVERPQAVL